MTILKEIKQKPLEYLFLSLGLITFFIFYIFIKDHYFRLYFIYAAGLFYLGWGIYHHRKRGDLNFSIIVEYFLISALGIILLSGTIF